MRAYKGLLLLLGWILSTLTLSAQTTQAEARKVWEEYVQNKKELSEEELEMDERNILRVEMLSPEELLVMTSEEEINLTAKEFREFIQYFLYNPDLLESYPEKKDKKFPHIGEQEVLSRHVIYFLYEKHLDKKSVDFCIHEMVAAYMDLRNNIAQGLYEKDLKLLDAATQKEIMECYPLSIEVSDYDETEEG
ncbi:MAG: hypothetical protein MJZ83_03545 [Bacteroidaceae bacterium]|nr:hypothetical protein [Bacteroidaceae bacterium]